MSERDERSPELPADDYDRLLDRLIGLPGGAHTQASVVQATDWYGKTTSYLVQCVRTESGDTVFCTQVNAAGALRYILPPVVVRTIERQRASLVTMVRRRHGKQLAAIRKATGGPAFTPEDRAKAAEARSRNAAARRARRAKLAKRKAGA